MPQSPLLGNAAIPSIPVSASSIGSDPGTTGIPGSPAPTDVDAALAAIQAEIDALLPLTGFLTTTYGEQAGLVIVSASGAAYTIDVSAADSWDITLSTACTLSLSNPAPSGVDSHIEVNLRGNKAVTFPGSLTFYDPITGLATTAPDFTTLDPSAQTPMEWASVDGGVTWGCELPAAFVNFGGFTAGGDLTGTSTSQTVAKINGSPLGSLSPATADRLRWNGSAWVNSALIWTPLTVYDGTNWLPLVDGSGNAILSEV